MNRSTYRYVGKNGERTRWRPYKGILPHISKQAKARLGPGYSVQIRHRVTDINITADIPVRSK